VTKVGDVGGRRGRCSSRPLGSRLGARHMDAGGQGRAGWGGHGAVAARAASWLAGMRDSSEGVLSTVRTHMSAVISNILVR